MTTKQTQTTTINEAFPTWFGKGCDFLCAKWEDENDDPNAREYEPVLNFCNHKDSKDQFESSCNPKNCPKLK